MSFMVNISPFAGKEVRLLSPFFPSPSPSQSLLPSLLGTMGLSPSVVLPAGRALPCSLGLSWGQLMGWDELSAGYLSPSLYQLPSVAHPCTCGMVSRGMWG